MNQYLYQVRILGEHGIDLTCMLPWDSDGPLKAANLEHEIRTSDSSPGANFSLECFDTDVSRYAIKPGELSVRIEELQNAVKIFIPMYILRRAILIIEEDALRVID